MKKGVEYTGVVTKVTFPNKGEVDCGEDGIASVKGTLPGQKVKFVVSKKRSGKAQGRLKEIIEKSPWKMLNLIAHISVIAVAVLIRQ